MFKAFSCFLFVAAFSGGVAMADDRLANEGLSDRSVQGKTEIPNRIKYAFFIKRYLVDIRESLVQELPQRDEQLLFALAVDDESQDLANAAQFSADRLNLCAKLTVISASEYALEYQRIVDGFRTRRIDRYLDTIDALSPKGRDIVENFIASVIEPSIQAQEEIDIVALARSNPEKYKAVAKLECSIAATGEIPPELQTAIERQRREFQEASELRHIELSKTIIDRGIQE